MNNEQKTVITCGTCKKNSSSSSVSLCKDGKRDLYNSRDGIDGKNHLNKLLLCQLIKHDIRLPCPNADDGCDEMIPLNDKIHKLRCMYRRFYCPLRKCGYKKTVDKIREHLQTEHKSVLSHSNGRAFNITPKRNRTEDAIIIHRHRMYAISFDFCSKSMKCKIKVTKIAVSSHCTEKFQVMFQTNGPIIKFFNEQCDFSLLHNSHGRINRYSMNKYFDLNESVKCTIYIDKEIQFTK